MSQTVYYTATTLDGFLADDEDSLDWLFVQEHDPAGPMSDEKVIEDAGALLMGATTYQWVVDHLRGTGEEWPYRQPTFVLSHRDLDRVDDAVRVVAADGADALRAVHAEAVAAAGGRHVWLVGGGGLAADLAALGLLDRVLVSIAPVTLGSGKPLLAGRTDLALTRVDRNGAFVCAWYDVVRPDRDVRD